MNTINCNNFNNICRTCLSNCDIKFPEDSIISNIFYLLTDIHFETNELPQQICRKCFEKINEIHAFSLQCKQSNFELIECLNKHKNGEIKQEIIDIKSEVVSDEYENEADIIGNLQPEVILNEFNETIIKKEIDDPEDDNYSDHDAQNVVENNSIKSISDVPFHCETCKKDFKNLSIYQTHKNTVCNEQIKNDNDDQRPYKCDQCSKAYSLKESLIYHKYVHSGERPFKCDQCSKAFAIKGSLVYHKRIHSNERPYKCDQCSKAFNMNVALIRHKRVHNNERPFKCDQCSKAYSLNVDLIRHKRTHVGERPFKCDQCSKEYSLKHSLNRHKLTHSNEHQFKCDQCPKEFHQKITLVVHKRTHTGVRPFQCDHCSKTFIVKSNLTAHMRTHRKNINL